MNRKHKTGYRAIMLLLCALVLNGCAKQPAAQPVEAFAFYGYITNCVTGKPAANTAIQVTGTTASTPGLFGTAGTTYNLGTTITDNNGAFRITPLKKNGVVQYCVSLTGDAQNIAFGNSITQDSIQQSKLSSYDMSLHSNSYGYLKVTYSDAVMPDTADILSIDLNCNGNACSPGFNSIQYAAIPAASPADLDLFYGNIQHGTLYFKVLGNNSNSIFYQKSSKHFSDTLHYASIYCTANDTTYYNFTY